MKTALLQALLCIACLSSYCQDSTLSHLPPAYLSDVSTRVTALDTKLDNKTAKAISALQKREAKIQKKLARLHPQKAKEVFGTAEEKYQSLSKKLDQPGALSTYIPYLDCTRRSN